MSEGMNKELAQYIVSIAQEAPKTIEVGGRTFMVHRGDVREIKEGRISPLHTNTLTSIIDYIKMPGGPDEWVIHVERHDKVVLTTHATGIDNERDVFVIAEIKAPGFPCDEFHDAEKFMVMAMSRLFDTPDKKRLLDFIGDIQDVEEQRVKDNGTSQTITARSGIATVADKGVPNPMELAPFRSFPDVAQTISPFILRVRKGQQCPQVGIFEADGGAWKSDTIREIAAHLHTALLECPHKKVHIIA